MTTGVFSVRRLLQGRALLFLPVLAFSAPTDAAIEASRTSCVAPCAVYFHQTEPKENIYTWDFGDGTTDDGFQSSHVFDSTGSHQVSLVRTDPSNGSSQTFAQSVLVEAFSGRTYYVDAQAGNDAHTGLCQTVQSGDCGPWRTVARVASFFNATVQNKTDIRFLFRAGQTFTMPQTGINAPGHSPEQAIFYLSGAQNALFGAYKPGGGEILPGERPVLQEFPERDSSLIQTWFTVDYNRVLSGFTVQDLHLRGNYEFPAVLPDDPSARGNYRTYAMNLDSGAHLLLRRLEVERMGGFATIGAGANQNYRGFFAHDCNVHHVQGTPLFGYVRDYSLRNSIIGATAQSHNHYLAAERGVIRGNVFRGSGMSVDVGRPPWMQCGLRLSSFPITDPVARTSSVLVSGNRMEDFTGSGFCVQPNPGSEHLPVRDIVFENNHINGQFLRTNAPHGESMELAVIGNADRVILRNNLLRNPRYDSVHVQNATDVGIFNNVIAERPNRTATGQLAINGTAVIGVRIQNNIFLHSHSPIFIRNRPGAPLNSIQIDRNLYFRLPTAPEFRVNGNWFNWSQWRSLHGQDAGSLYQVDPLFVADNPVVPEHFRLTAGSPALHAGWPVAGVFDDFAGRRRPIGQAWDLGIFEDGDGVSDQVFADGFEFAVPPGR